MPLLYAWQDPPDGQLAVALVQVGMQRLMPEGFETHFTFHALLLPGRVQSESAVHSCWQRYVVPSPRQLDSDPH